MFETTGICLSKYFAAGGHENRVYLAAGFAANMLPAVIERLGKHNTAAPSAVGVIIYLHLLVCCIIAYLMALDTNKSAILASSQNAFTKHVPDNVGEQRHNVDSQLHTLYEPERNIAFGQIDFSDKITNGRNQNFTRTLNNINIV